MEIFRVWDDCRASEFLKSYANRHMRKRCLDSPNIQICRRYAKVAIEPSAQRQYTPDVAVDSVKAGGQRVYPLTCVNQGWDALSAEPHDAKTHGFSFNACANFLLFCSS